MNDKLNKQTQEQQQMAANDERTRQMMTAHKNQLRNQEQESPDRAKPKAKSEPKPNPISTLDIVESPAVNEAQKKTNVTDFTPKKPISNTKFF